MKRSTRGATRLKVERPCIASSLPSKKWGTKSRIFIGNLRGLLANTGAERKCDDRRGRSQTPGAGIHRKSAGSLGAIGSNAREIACSATIAMGRHDNEGDARSA